jgi:hypothetical protein
MNTHCIVWRLCRLALVLAVASTPSFVLADDLKVVGPWNLTVAMDDGSSLEVVLTVAQNGDQLSGKMVGQDGQEVEVTDMMVVDGDLKFEMVRDFGGQPLSTKFRLKADGDKLDGTVDYDIGGQAGTLNVTGVRGAAEAGPVDAVGTWQLLVMTPDGAQIEPQVKINKNGDKLEGIFVSIDGSEVPLSNVALNGDELTAEASVDFGGQTLVTKFKGKISGDDFTGSVDYDLGGQTGTLDVTGKRQAAVVAVDPVGTWQLLVMTPDGAQIEPQVKINKNGDKLEGIFVSIDGSEVPLSNVAISGSELTAEASVDFGGQTLVTKFKGNIEGDDFKGSVDYDLGGQTGTLDVTGKRQAAVASADPVGTWQLLVMTPDGAQIEPQVKINKNGDKLEGIFVSIDGSEVPLSNVAISGNELTAEASVDFGGQTLVTKFKGNIEGDDFKGSVDYDLGGQTGTLDVTGKRQAEVAAVVVIDPSGTWQLLVATPDGAQIEPQVKIKKNGDKLEGIFVSIDGSEVPLSGVAISGNELTAEASVDFGGQTLVTKFKGNIEGDDFKGSVDYDLGGQTGTLDVTGKRQVGDPVGVWQLLVMTPDGAQIEPQVKISKNGDKLEGIFVSIDGSEVNLSSVAFSGGELTAEASVDFGGQQLVTKFKGNIEGDDFKGSVDYDLGGQTGTLDVTGKRQGAAAAGPDLAGVWAITITAENGQTYEPTLTLQKEGDKLVGEYAGQTGTGPVSDLNVSGDQVSFKVVRERDGQEFTVKYSGQLKGDSMQGTVDFDFGGQTGSAAFEAKRK